MTLTRFDENGIELILDTRTGETFSSIRGLARMGTVAKQIVDRCLEREGTVKQVAKIITPGGMQQVALIPIKSVIQVLFILYSEKPTLSILKALTAIYQQQGLDVMSLGHLEQSLKKIKVNTKGVTFVYLIGCKKTKTLKIGYSQNIKRRLKTLQSGNPFELEILGKKIGSPELEECLHRKFKTLRLQGEWFKWDEKILKEFGISITSPL